tara:strand:+ start:7824 stop:8630 length:807 start_codon:yes stop_codon:yes gene_type:complete
MDGEYIKHPSVRECFNWMNIDDGVEVIHTADIPAKSGMGSSSAFTVGLLHGLSALNKKIISKRSLAVYAQYVEQEMIKENVGTQDQVACSFGGLNHIKFSKHCGDSLEDFSVNPIIVKNSRLLEDRLMLFYTGKSRNASEIVKEQLQNMDNYKSEMLVLSQLVNEGLRILGGASEFINDFGAVLHESWMIKKFLSSQISNDKIDLMYSKAIKNGATGGKILGAGSGGFLLLFAPPELHNKVRLVLKDYLYVPFKFENTGSQIIFYSEE